MVLGIVLPVVYVDVREAGYEKLQLLFVEDGNQFCRDDVMES